MGVFISQNDVLAEKKFFGKFVWKKSKFFNFFKKILIFCPFFEKKNLNLIGVWNYRPYMVQKLTFEKIFS